ncbi:DUF6318 family protein [Arthrobacter sp. MDT1-65]
MALVLLTGCQSDPDPTTEPGPEPPPSSSSASSSASAVPTASATPEPSPASSAGPAANIPVPVKPALADENSAEGLEAFTEYWFELFSYGYETNDWAPFNAVTDPGCRTCEQTREVVRGSYSDGGWIRGGEFELLDFSVDFRVNTSGSIQGFVDYQQSDLMYYDKHGRGLLEKAPEASLNTIYAVYQETGWLLLDFGKPEGT